jgi:quercetin dioxygenase-like cupin family protein
VWRVRIARRATADTDRRARHWPDWRDAARYSPEGPGIRVLHASTDLKVVLVTLSPGQALPIHPGAVACFHVLDGTGSIVVDDDQIAVSAGSTVIAPPGSVRAVRASTPLVFLGSLGEPAAEGVHP